MHYEKPIILANDELAEGVYAASGDTADTSTGTGTVKCDSKYMGGTWQAPDYSAWNGKVPSYRENLGCNGCPAFRAAGCGLLLDYVDSGYSSSYEANSGNYMPSWEREGHKADDLVSW